MSAADLDDLRRAAVGLAQRAGEAILAVYRGDFAVERKDDHSPLTEADLAAHRILVDGLRALAPELPVLSEESAAVPFAERRRWTRYWLVDPLDGTREFIKRNDEFTVNIALIDDGAPILGVVLAPALGYLAHATRAGGVAEDARGTRRLAVAPADPACLRVAGSRSHRGAKLDAMLATLDNHAMVPMGSSLKFCEVAEGRADVYPRFGATSEWDTAAGQCVLEAAGGRVTDLELRPLRYNTGDSLINPEFLAFGDDTLDWRTLARV